MRAGGLKRRSRKQRLRTECHISVLLEWKRDQPELVKTKKQQPICRSNANEKNSLDQAISDRLAANQQPGTS